MAKSKLTFLLHQFVGDNKIFDWLLWAQPVGVKVFNQPNETNLFAPGVSVRALVPNIPILYRQYWDSENYREDAAHAFYDPPFKDAFDKLRGRGVIWETAINEPSVQSVDDAKALNNWTLKWCDFIHAWGEQVAVFAFSVGNPTDLSLVPYLAPAARAADYITLHEYISPQLGDPFQLVGRCAQFIAALPADARKPVIISEFGIDDGQRGGWQKYYGNDFSAYLELLKKGDDRYAALDFVKFVTVFQEGEGGDWATFNTHPIGRAFSDVIGNYSPTPVPGPLPTPEPTPSPAPIPEPSVAFSIIPDHIQAGAKAIARWDVEGVKEVYFEGAGVVGHDQREVSPPTTRDYHLRVVFLDKPDEILTRTLQVTPAPIPTPSASPTPSVAPTPSAPPSDELTDEPVRADLRTYPRPPQDNGIGIDFRLNLTPKRITEGVAWAKSIHATWSLVAGQDWNQILAAATPLYAAGIMPVCRLICKIDKYNDFVVGTQRLRAAGIPAYIQIYNEPGDSREWRGRPNIARFGAQWAANASAVFDAGGYPGIQVLGYDEWQAAINPLLLNRPDVLKRTWFCLHNGGANHPPNYPYDDVNQLGAPEDPAEFLKHEWKFTDVNQLNAVRLAHKNTGATIYSDDTAVLRFIEYQKWMKDSIGYTLPIIGGEAGWGWGDDEDDRYYKIDTDRHARWTVEMLEWFRKGVLSNGDPLPDELFSVACWIMADQGANDWWGGPLGTKQRTIDAVAAIPEFTRKFNYIGLPTPEPSRSHSPSPSAPPVPHSSSSASPSPSPAPPSDVVDPRAAKLGVAVRSTPGAIYHVSRVDFDDVTEAQNNHIILFTVFDELGSPRESVNCWVDWVGRDPGDVPTKMVTNKKGQCNFPMYANLDIHKLNGPYFAYVENTQVSDVVTGMGLPEHRHVNFRLIFGKGG